MFKQLKIYYVFVSLPFAFLLLGAAIFSDAIISTIIHNPHPQINYAIFCIILFGGLLILLSVYRLMHEAKTIVEYSEAVHANADVDTLKKMAQNYTGDIAYILQMLTATGGRPISHQEQVAIEHELTNARSRLSRRNALPQYLSGLLVGMGLLGTFIGLLSTLTDIATLISSFADLDMATASPILVFRTMIDRMKAPMQSMSIAFSASMFGLLGSIVLGLMMVGIRRLQGDISSRLSSEVARHIEIALSYEGLPAGSGAGAVVRNEAVIPASGAAYSGDEYRVLVRIEERLAETARNQQRILSSEIEDFQKQRADMLRTLAEQTESNNNFRSELQRLGRQFGSILTILENGNGQISNQISELPVHLTRIEDRLAETARLQQRILSAEVEDFQKQRADMLRTLAEQTEANNNFRSELQRLGRQFGSVISLLEKGNGEITNQISELTVHMTADAKESHKLLAMQMDEQVRLREALDVRTN